MRQLFYKAYRIDEKYIPLAVGLHAAYRRIESRKKLILHIDIRTAERVQHGRFARIRVSHKGYRGNFPPLSVSAEQRAAAFDLFKLVFEIMYLAHYVALVRLELRFIKEDGVELPAKIYLFQGLPKADKMELIIQKAVELGAFQVIPVSMKRCVVKLDEKKADAKIKRWQGIAEAAAKQSKRGVIPTVAPVMSYVQAVKTASEMDLKLVPYELAEGMPQTKQLIESARPGQQIAIFIGPEGGFDPEEIRLATEAGIQPITLGKRILRTETAGFTTIAWLMYQLEN